MQGLTALESWKALRSILVTLACLMLVGAVAGSGIGTVQSSTEPYFTLYAQITTDPHWGYYGGYHDMWYQIQPEWAEIGVNFEIGMVDAYTWWDTLWDSEWNVTGAEGGWDISCSEWWLQPDAPPLWFESLVYSWLTPPQGGYNIAPWMNEKADELLYTGLHTLDAVTRKNALWEWQEEFMHDPPLINVYYPKCFEVTSVWLEGWAYSSYLDYSHWAINETLFEQYAPEWRKTEPGTIIYGQGWEPVWNWNPLYLSTYSDANSVDSTLGVLYKSSMDPWPPVGQQAPYENYCQRPHLATALPTFMDGPNGPNTRARIPLREGVLWADGDDFNATDVKFSFDLILNPETKSVGYGDIEPTLETVEYVPLPLEEGGYIDPYTGQGPINPYVVDLILKAPSPDLANILTNDWGGAVMLPWHTLKDIPPKDIRSHPMSYDWQVANEYLPSIGPFIRTGYVEGEYVEFTRNDLYFGYDLGWGPYNIDKVIYKWTGDAAGRLAAIQAHEIDFGEYMIGPVEKFEELKARLDLTVWQYDRSVGNMLWLNLDNPIISNRYVRMAMAHAIPYETIFYEILPSWGIEAIPGKTYILPHHYYTHPVTNETVHLFNDDLLPYEYNLTRAEMYLNMWVYSQKDTDYTLGPVGDADFSGVVRLDDFIVWATNFGTEPADWTFLQGNDIDPDFDNSGLVNLDDFIEWAANYGNYYPFEGAR